MNRPFSLAVLAAALQFALGATAEAHTLYKDLNASNPAPAVITGNQGWADGADADLGDSHALVYFKFKLASRSLVTIRVATVAQAVGSSTASAGLDPAFSLYKGLLPELSHDETTTDPLNPRDGSNSPIAHPKDSAYWDSLSKVREGQFDALGTWSMANDDGDWSEVEYIAHKNDHVGRGETPDSSPEVLENIELAPGEYMIVVGGGLCADCDPDSFFGAEVGLTVTPMEGPGSVADECAATSKKVKPVLDSLETEWNATVGEEIVIPVTAYDCNEDPLSIAAGKRPKGAKVSAATYESRTQKWGSQFTWTPQAKQAGKTYTVNFKAKEKVKGRKLASKAGKVRIKVNAAAAGLSGANLFINRAQWQAESGRLLVSGKLSGGASGAALARSQLVLLGGGAVLPVQARVNSSGNWSAEIALPESAVPCEVTAQFGGRAGSRSVKRAPSACQP